ncbi:type 2 periplasmic-binding domain-containing protein [Cohnella cholangitidis]|uniref:Extracellular solute-binding protein n=1 Tax=Cohnella cholangitidis TaxID=2598458 RepID=A0A7G5C449_9BACL|nr:extracellular solute-binding protein [Cohnella cholangitidis]QMV43983.1 extracellular solute-binding protein [Cohnella cholangitidis]
MLGRKKLIATTMITALLGGLIAGCSSNNNENSQTSSTAPSSNAATETASQQPADFVDIEVWWTNPGLKGIDKGSPLYNLYAEKLGVGVISPYVEWNGGTDYLNTLNTNIAAGEMPNVFLPWNGIEADLAKNGAIVDLTDLLPKYAPNLWKLIPENVWNVVKAADPTGQGRIYWVPGVNAYEKTTGLIRKDWLDKLGLSMPKTQEEYVNVLKAFKEKDPNGNGQADEIPTGGRADARWMDHLFNMNGVAMLEGYPEWDVYNGELTYSAVTPNMKDALAFISKLYKEKLIDQETFLNDKAAWDGKIDSNLVGNYYHWGQGVSEHLGRIEKASGVKADLAVLPVIQAPDYEGKGFIATKQVGIPQYVVSAQQDEKHLMASLKFLNGIADQANWMDLFMGAEGMHYKVENGKKVILPEDKSTQQNKLNPQDQFGGSTDFIEQMMFVNVTPEVEWQFKQNVRNMKELQQYVKVIGGDGLPATVYDDYPDIKNRMLWNEYATKIIIGTYSIDKFDEFVEKWNKSGGEEVTKRAREWYAKAHK